MTMLMVVVGGLFSIATLLLKAVVDAGSRESRLRQALAADLQLLAQMPADIEGRDLLRKRIERGLHQYLAPAPPVFAPTTTTAPRPTGGRPRRGAPIEAPDPQERASRILESIGVVVAVIAVLGAFASGIEDWGPGIPARWGWLVALLTAIAAIVLSLALEWGIHVWTGARGRRSLAPPR